MNYDPMTSCNGNCPHCCERQADIEAAEHSHAEGARPRERPLNEAELEQLLREVDNPHERPIFQRNVRRAVSELRVTASRLRALREGLDAIDKFCNAAVGEDATEDAAETLNDVWTTVRKLRALAEGK